MIKLLKLCSPNIKRSSIPLNANFRRKQFSNFLEKQKGRTFNFTYFFLQRFVLLTLLTSSKATIKLIIFHFQEATPYHFSNENTFQSLSQLKRQVRAMNKMLQNKETLFARLWKRQQA